jgi:hypothetical protein
MPQVTGDTVKRILFDLYGYEISGADAEAIARTAGAMITLSSQLGTVGIEGIEPPFGYPVVTAEAARLSKIKR